MYLNCFRGQVQCDHCVVSSAIIYLRRSKTEYLLPGSLRYYQAGLLRALVVGMSSASFRGQGVVRIRIYRMHSSTFRETDPAAPYPVGQFLGEPVGSG